MHDKCFFPKFVQIAHSFVRIALLSSTKRTFLDWTCNFGIQIMHKINVHSIANTDMCQIKFDMECNFMEFSLAHIFNCESVIFGIQKFTIILIVIQLQYKYLVNLNHIEFRILIIFNNTIDRYTNHGSM